MDSLAHTIAEMVLQPLGHFHGPLTQDDHIAVSEYACEKVIVLLNFAPDFEGGNSTVPRHPNLPDFDYSEYSDYTDHKYDAPKGSGKRSSNAQRVFLKRWCRFLSDFCGDEVRWRSKVDGHDDKAGGIKLFTDDEKLSALNPCGRLAYLTAKHLYPNTNFEDLRAVLKSTDKLDDYYVDPNSKTRKQYEFEHEKKARVRERIRRTLGELETTFDTEEQMQAEMAKVFKGELATAKDERKRMLAMRRASKI